jgi:hypothetical protein
MLERLSDGPKQTAAGVGRPMLSAGAAALLGGLMITGVSLDVSSAMTAMSDPFTPDPATARVLGTVGAVVALTGLIGGTVPVAVTTRIAQKGHTLPTWAI